jgi:Lon protease-like protein
VVDTQQLPLFPLNTVLFPGGQLALRIFEARYLDLVSQCGHNGQGFGVCLILEGEEVGAPAVPAAIGCEARIADFSTGADGLLVLSVQGERRFHVERSRIRDNGLIMADVSWYQAPTHQAVAPEHQLLSLLLRRIVERAGAPHDRVEKHCFEDADWVSWRLAEWLPLSWPDRQFLLQESDARARLQKLVELIPEYQTF